MRPLPPCRACAATARSCARPGNTGSGTAARTAARLQQAQIAASWRASQQLSSGLVGNDHQLREAVGVHVQAEEALDDVGERIDAAADERFFVDCQAHLDA